MLHMISMFTFPSDPSSFLFWRFISSTSQKLWFSPYVFKALFILENENTHFWSDFMFTKWQKHVFQAVSCYKMKKQAFEVFFTFTKRKHDLIWSDFMLMKWKNTLLKRFSCLQHKKHVFEALFMFTKWKKVLKRNVSSKFIFLYRKIIFVGL